MKVRREPPSEQLDYSINAPLKIDVAGRAYRVADWSLEGFTIANFSDLQTSATPVVGLSGTVNDSLREEAIKAGMADLSKKTMNKKAIVALIESKIRKIDENTPSLARSSLSVIHNDELEVLDDNDPKDKPQSKTSDKKKKILFADDDPTMRTLFKAMFKDSEYNVNVVEDGQDALDALNDRSYDLILMDMRMPKLGGLEAVKKLRDQGSFKAGYLFDCIIHVPFQNFDISFKAEAVVEGYTKYGELRATFMNLGEREESILSFFLEELIRGAMTVIDDVIVHIDRPVELVSTEDNETGQTGVTKTRAFSPKLFIMSTLYFLVGLFVLSYVYLLIQDNFFRLEVETAVVNAPLETIYASQDGKIATLTRALGEPVLTDQPLVVIANAQIEGLIETTLLDITRKRAELISKKALLLAERRRFNNYRATVETRIAQAEAEVDALEKRTQLAKQQVDRFKHLLKRGFSTQSKVDEALSDYVKLSGDLENARLALQQQIQYLESLERDDFYEGKGQIRELEVDIQLAKKNVNLAKKQLEILEKRKERLILTAPGQGHLLRILRPVGASVKKGESIALFERNEARVIHAYLSQEEILEIGLNDPARIFFPSLNERVEARVFNLDRTEGYIDEMNARYNWRGSKDRTALVILQIEDLSNTEIRNRFTPGLPAVVLFTRRETNEIKANWGLQVGSLWQNITDLYTISISYIANLWHHFGSIFALASEP